ncbi:MAG TPA: glycogen/starch/alpha-glucan phosphorylase, partial [Holophagaceae bacterium]
GREPEPGLGNGGLGRLAACYLDSMATLGVPAIGYGIRYEFGMFTQEIEHGAQVEFSDKWLRLGFPWELAHAEHNHVVGLGGATQTWTDEKGRLRVRWIPQKKVLACAHDVPVIGHGGLECNVLRLWRAEAVQEFDFEAFNSGEYIKSVQDKMFSETISKVLYPNDDRYQGKQLRLGQQYFFVSASLQDMIHIQQLLGKSLETFHETFAVQLNDTHPAIGVAELMRLLVDEHHMDWDTAWGITTRTFSYTNHTLLPEALEKWSVPLFAEVLPRHLEIVYEINRRFLDEVRQTHPGDDDLVRRLSLIDESGPRYVRMAHLATVGSRAVNGVAALHTELLKRDVLRDFEQLSPGKIVNVTNGVTPRRWLALCNPRLAALINSRIGERWQTRFEDEIIRLEEYASDPEFRELWRQAKRGNKEHLAALAKAYSGTDLDPNAMFDVQVKRIHEYKRQHLNVLRVVALYNRLKRDPGMDFVPRAVIFGGKAAPGYYMAKKIIKLINSVSQVVNADPAVAGRLKVGFAHNFNVRSGQVIYPAADLSQQISLAGKEASGTGNMKFGINGAVTIGTLDGANVEMRQCVGQENFFLFGLTTEQVAQAKQAGYDPRRYSESDPELREALEQI